MSHNYKEIYAFRAAMRWAWNHPPTVNTCVALRQEFRDRNLKLTRHYIQAFQAANKNPFTWKDPCFYERPKDKYGKPIYSESKVDRLRMNAWIAAAESLLPKELL